MIAAGRGALPSPRPTSGRQGPGGFTLIEVLFVTGIVAVLAAAAVPSSRASLDRSRANAAARFLAARMTQARAEAVKRSAHVALRFQDESGRVAFRVFLDGNRDGVRTRDIADGVDAPIGPAVQLADLFPGVAIALADGSGGPPVQVGTSRMLSFTPVGTATSGSVYVRGRDGTQLAVRVLGATGRTRVQRRDPGTGEWIDLAW